MPFGVRGILGRPALPMFLLNLTMPRRTDR